MRLALLAVSLALGFDCPDGQVRVQTDNPYEPFKCQEPSAKGSLLSTVGGPRGFKTRPRCPRGFHPVMTPNALQPYRCVKKAPGNPAEPDLAAEQRPVEKPVQRGVTIGETKGPKDCGPRAKRVRVENDPFDPWRCVPLSGPAAPKDYKRYTIPGELSLDVPRDWQLTDGWRDEVPTLYVLHDGGGAQSVTLSITRSDAGQDGFEPLEEHLVKEREWQQARDAGAVKVSGLAARSMEVPGQSRAAYLAVSADRYYSIAYSAPPQLFKTYLPVYERVLKSFKLAR